MRSKAQEPLRSLMGVLYYEKIRFLVLGLLLPRAVVRGAHFFQDEAVELLVGVLVVDGFSCLLLVNRVVFPQVNAVIGLFEASGFGFELRVRGVAYFYRDERAHHYHSHRTPRLRLKAMHTAFTITQPAPSTRPPFTSSSMARIMRPTIFNRKGLWVAEGS